MNNIISINEIRIKMALKEATDSLIRARTLISNGEDVPRNLIPKLEKIIEQLEKQLIDILERG
jgi:hypothetical protein